MPERVQLRRTKGWRMPANTMKVDRTTRYGNPFYKDMVAGYTVEDAVRDHRDWMTGARDFPEIGPPPDVTPLRGRNLACWCGGGKPCHVFTLLVLANPGLQAAPLARPSNLQGERLGLQVAEVLR